MPTPDHLDLRLCLPGLPELEPLARDFARHALCLADFEGEVLEALLASFLASLAGLEERLQREGDPIVDLEISARIDAIALEFSILEHGMPLGEEPAGVSGGARATPVFERVWWVQKGTSGSELHLKVHRPHPSIDLLEAVRSRLDGEPSGPDDLEPSSRTGEYRIRPYAATDGLAIARRIYEAYGRSYINPDLYVPERIERLNGDGRLHSIVCESADGEIVGHYALERPDLGPTGEAGQAVIDHRHRGHGLMRPMRRAVEAAGAELELLGIWSQPTAMHPISQIMNQRLGSVPTAVHLGLLPGGVTLRRGVTGEATRHAENGRRSTFLYWHPLGEEPPLTAHAPEPLHSLLADLYAARGRSVTLEGDARPASGSSGNAVHCRLSANLGCAAITVDRIDESTHAAIQAAVEAMTMGSNAGVVHVDLPLDDAGTPMVAAALLEEGFAFAGVAPRSIPRAGALRAEDALRLALHPAPIDLPGLVAEGDLGRRLALSASRGEWSPN
jgi:hypothetical protein